MHYQLPLKGVSLGHWIPSLRSLIDKKNQLDPLSDCDVIHKLFNQLPKLKWNDIQTIQFDNGIYIVFEKGELYKKYDRIVRIGTHTSDGRLKARLKNHFITENKDGSIFRKNIGLALLSLADDPYAEIWNLNTSSPDVCAKYATKIDKLYQKNIEQKVTQYIQDNMSFVCIPVDQTSDRLRLEEGLIATLNQSAEFRSSSNWLGLHNPKSEISQSGLWNSQCLNGDPLNQRELKHIADIVSNALSMMKNHTNLLNRGNQSSTEEREHKIQQKQSMSTAEIAEHINQKLKHAKQLGYEYLDVVSGDIHCELHLTNYMPSVCAAMRKIKQPQDQVLHTTPSGNSSTIKFRYFLKDRMYQLKIGW